MRLFETSVLLVALIVASAAAFAGDALPSTSEARASMPYTGTAVMQEDGAISLHLRLSSDGKDIDDTLTYKTTDRGYDNVLRHLGGLNPGESKPFSPWKD
jgi:FlaG/FlaF family flagellin (archaellin)